MDFPLERQGSRRGVGPSFVVVGGGPEPCPERLALCVPAGAQVIAADGGLRLCHAMRLCASVLVGDMDTLTPEEVAQAEAEGTNVHPFPSDKDQSDLELAILEAHRMGARRMTLLGALGGQWDHCLANLLAPLSLCQSLGIWGRLVTAGAEIYLLSPGSYLLRGQSGSRASLMALSESATGVSLDGFEYRLENDRLTRQQTRGLANVVRSEQANLRLDQGELLLTLVRRSQSMDEQARS
jgi:thiamine pyrophosphokinase